MSLVLTGISNDISLDGDDTGEFYLVFNNGELRVPVPSDSIRVVLSFRQQRKDSSSEEEIDTLHTNQGGASSYFNEEGVNQI